MDFGSFHLKIGCLTSGHIAKCLCNISANKTEESVSDSEERFTSDMHTKFWFENLKGRDHLENLGVDGK